VGKITAKDAVGQTAQALKNIRAILTAAGLSAEHVVKTTIFLADMNDFAAVNEAYGEFFHDDPPARSTVEVSKLPMDAKVEIDAIAMRRPVASA
jgi:2-iminobutanoate/2-iminopropanoate deaminase